MNKDFSTQRTSAFVCVCLCAGLFYKAPAAQSTATDQLHRSSMKPNLHEERLKRVPLKYGMWQQSVFQGERLVDGAGQSEMCPNSYSFSPFPSLTLREHIGRQIPHEMMDIDAVWRCADGTYRVSGGMTTTLGGDVTYTHIITLHGNDSYNDIFTVTLHARTHPTKHFYTGSGHWVAPCPSESR